MIKTRERSACDAEFFNILATHYTSVPGHKFCTIGVRIRKSLWGQGFGLAAGLLPGVRMVQDF